MQKQSGDKAKKTNLVEVFGERVFVTSPRVFSFSHRSFTSIRHPFMVSTVTMINAEGESKSKRGSSRGERMAEYINDFADEDKWKTVARMLDSMLFEKDITARRQHAQDNALLRRTLEMWWCKAGGTPTRGVREDAYKQVHMTLYRELLQVSDVAMHGIVTKSINQDWAMDSEGTGEVSFGKWYLSLLEIADNWVSSCDGESYGQFLERLLEQVFPKTMPSNCVASARSNWTETAEMLKRNSRLYRSHKLIGKQWSARHTIVYSPIPVPM